MINSELLKSAIADAKAVRATALANAKASLEEAFAPRFEAMFAEKLKGESEEDEMIAEVEAPNQVSGKGGEAKGPATKAVTKGQPKKVSDGNTNWKVVAVGGSEGAAGSKAPAATQSIVKETSEEDEEGKMDEQYEEEGKIEEAGLTSEDLDEIIKELESEVGEEVPQEPTGEVPAVPAPQGEVPQEPVAQSPEGEVPMAPQAPEGEEMGEVPQAPVAQSPEGEVPQAPQAPVANGDEEINLEELLAALNEESEEDESMDEGKLPPWLKKKDGKEDKEDTEDKEEVDEAVENGVPKNVGGQDKTGGTNVYPKGPDASKNQLKGKNHNISGAGNIGTGETGGKPKMEENKYKVALKESYDTISYLRGQINEVNLLNAKLLYTNRLFKEFASVLDDTYRMKIVENFDLTKSVREVKLAYALLAESLNFGTRSTTPKMVSQKPLQRKVVTQIAEGLASKSVASTKPSKELISEGGNEMALRFKKLAGIKEAPKSK